MTNDASRPRPSSPSSPGPLAASPFHEGEQRIQARLGVREEMEPWGRQVIRGALPEQHREFYAEQPFLVVAARDEEDRPWVTLLTGSPGFAFSPDPGQLVIGATPSPGDPLHGQLRPGSDVGLLGIEPHSRRRNRVNGRVTRSRDGEFAFSVDQCFGNCPKHITERIARATDPSLQAATVRRSTVLSSSLQRWIAAADTFFIATGYQGDGGAASHGMDASHRGGPPGFVRVLGDHTLEFDDYAGNNHFNTLGNLSLDSRAGLSFVDFETGALLHLSGRARVMWRGGQRSIRFDLDEALERPHALPLRWNASGRERELRVAEVREESADVRSFLLASEDGAPLAPFLAGQYLPLSLSLPGHQRPVERTYSLSGSPRDPHYRITVKRESHGLVSRYLHDEVRIGEVLRAGAPGGTFGAELDPPRPVVLVSAGVGLTPMVAMLHVLAGLDVPVIFVHGTRDGAHHALRNEVRGVVGAHANTELHVVYSRPGEDDIEGVDYDSVGRLGPELLEKLLPGLDADFYLCGPPSFVADLQNGLEEAGVMEAQVHAESFAID